MKIKSFKNETVRIFAYILMLGSPVAAFYIFGSGMWFWIIALSGFGIGQIINQKQDKQL